MCMLPAYLVDDTHRHEEAAEPPARQAVQPLLPGALLARRERALPVHPQGRGVLHVQGDDQPGGRPMLAPRGALDCEVRPRIFTT